MNMLARNIEVAHEANISGGGPRLSSDALVYLDRVRSRGWRSDIRAAFDRADVLNILFVGETIIDEYRYVAPLAKPSKEFILATVEAREPEQFLGGVVAASLHGEWKNTKVVTDDGEPIKKTRFVEDGTARKVGLEIYNKTRLVLSDAQRSAFQHRLRTGVRAADVVVAFDFGHGLIGPREERFVEAAQFLGLNVQTNAGNYGFNPVSKYRKANLVCVDMPEAQLATGLQYETDPTRLIGHLVEESEHTIITHGRQGCYCPWHVPAFGARAIDTMGAGDAFLAVTAPLVAAGLELEAAAFVGNVAGAIKTDIVGHRRHVGRQELLQTIEGLLA